MNPSGIDTFRPRRQPLEGEALMGVREAGAGLGEVSKARALMGPRVIPPGLWLLHCLTLDVPALGSFSRAEKLILSLEDEFSYLVFSWSF